MNNKIKGKISTLFMLVVLFAQTLTPVVTVFAEDTTSGTQASSEVQSLNETLSSEKTHAEGTSSTSASSTTVPPSENKTAPTSSSTEVSTSTETSTSASNEATSVSQEETTITEENTEEDEEPAQSSTEASESTTKPKQSLKGPTVLDASGVNIIGSATSVTMKLKGNNGVEIEIEDGKEYDVDLDLIDYFEMAFSFDVTDDSLGSQQLEANTPYEFALPLALSVDTGGAAIPLTDSQGIQIGEYSVQNGVVQIIFNENFVNRTDRTFHLDFTGELNKDAFNNDRHQDVKIPFGDNKEFEMTFHAKSEGLEGADYKKMKTYVLENGSKIETTHRASHADWVIRVNDEMNRYPNATVKDQLSAGHKIDTSSFEVYRMKRQPNGDPIGEEKVTLTPAQLAAIQAGGFDLTFSPLEDTYELRYTTLIEEQELGAEKTTISNAVSIQLGNKDENNLSAEEDITWGENTPSITKKAIKQEGEYAQWEVQYNYGNLDLGDTTTLMDFVDIGHFDENDLGMTIQEVTTNAQGQIQDGRTLSANEYTTSVDSNGKLTIKIPNSQNKGYLLTYHSILPGGLEDETITNTVEDSRGDTDSAKLPVNTTPGIVKSGQVAYENGQAYIDWEVTFNSNGYSFNHPFTLIDTFETKHLTLDVGSVKINGEELKSTEKLDTNNTGFKLTINPVEAKEYKLTYRTKVTDAGLNAENLKNEAHLSWEQDGSGGIGTNPDYGITGIKPGMSKDGKYGYDVDTNTEYIEWTITFNQKKLNLMSGTVLTDVFSDASLEMIGTPVVTKTGTPTQVTVGTDYTYAATTSPKGFTLTFPNGTAAETYTVKYNTTLPLDPGGKVANTSVKNTATLTWQGTPDEADKTVTPRQPGVTKAGSVMFDQDGTKWNKWVVSFNTNKHIIRDLVVTDVFKPVTATLKGEPELYTGGTLVGTDLTGATELTLADVVTYTPPVADTDTNSQTMTFAFKDDNDTEAKVYRLVYYTSSTPEDEKFAARNDVQLRGVGVVESQNKNGYQINKPTLSIEKKSTGVNKETDPRRIAWEIRANTGEGKNEFVQLVDAYLEDTIPLDQRLVKETIVLINEDTGTETPYTALEGVSGNDFSDNTFKISLPDGTDTYKATYETEILQYPSAAHALNPNKQKDLYVNEVTITDKHQETKKANATAKYFKEDNNTPTKEGEYDQKSDSIAWTVEVNQAGLPLLKTDEHEAQIIDQLDNQQTYVENSVVVEVKDGEDYTVVPTRDYEPAFATNADDKDQTARMTITFNERTTPLAEKAGNITHTYRVTYKTVLKAFVFGNKNVTNKIALSTNGEVTGGSVDEEGASQPIAKWHFGGGGTGQTVGLTATKVDNDDPTKQLPDVKFNLYSQKLDGTKAEVEKNLTTSELGKLILTGLWYGKFVLEETKARPGYELASEPIHFGLEGNQTGGTTLKLLDENGNGKEYSNVTIVDGQLQIKNTRSTTNITATKTWTGTGLPNQKPTIYFTLYSKVVDTETSTKVETKQVGETGDTVTVDFGALPTHNDSGKELEYYVVETDATGNDYTPKYYSKETTANLEITNTFIQEEISLKVVKQWDDFQNKNQTRPEFIYLHILQNGEIFGKKSEPIKWEVEKSGESQEQTLAGFELPQVDNNGEAYEYTVIEVDEKGDKVDQIPGEKNGDVYDVKTQIELYQTTIVNTLRNQTSLSGEKIWTNEDDKASYTRPVEIEIQLLRNGDTFKSQTIGGSNTTDTWTYEFDSLEKYDENGDSYVYTVEEIGHPGYTTEITGTTITNTLNLTKVPVQKNWVDDSDNTARPSSIIVELLRKTADANEITAIDNVVLEEQNDWYYEFTGLPTHNAAGKEFTYSVRETNVPAGYAAAAPVIAENGTHVITNTLVPADTIVVKKVWDDASDTSVRPDSIQVQLYRKVAGGTKEAVGAASTLSKADMITEFEWQMAFDGLASHDKEGKEYTYFVEEISRSGSYTTEVSPDDATTVINTLETVSIPVEKIWHDPSDISSRATNVVIDLYRETTKDTTNNPTNGEAFRTLELALANEWKDTFTGLAKFDKAGEAFEYSIKEREVPGYTTQIMDSQAEGFEVTNTLELTKVNVTKNWSDFSNKFNLRPDTIHLQLMKRVGEELVPVEKQVIDPETKEVTTTTVEMNLTDTDKMTNENSATFSELTKYDENGVEIDYVVTETPVPGYETSVATILSEVDGEKNIIVTNTLETTKVHVAKNWSDFDNRFKLRPDNIQVDLFQGETKLTPELVPVAELTKDGDWVYTFDNLPKYDTTGKEINEYVYTIEEQAVPGYTSSIVSVPKETEGEARYQITNTLETTKVHVAKNWSDFDNRFKLRPDSIQVDLFQGETQLTPELIPVAELTKDGDWVYTFDNLPKYDTTGPEISEYVYTIEEQAVPGYTSSIVSVPKETEGEAHYQITNTLETIDVPVTKAWQDKFKGKENYYGNRPESITIRLHQNKQEIAQVPAAEIVDQDGNWRHVFKDLPKYDAAGELYEYTVTEDAVDKYNQAITGDTTDGFTVTNTRKTYAIGDYVWIDTNQDGKQDTDEEPLAGVKVELFDENGEPILDKDGNPMTTETDKDGRYLFDELEDGKYTVKFTLTKDQAKKYEFTKQNSGKEDQVDSDADELTGWTTTIILDDDNKELTKDYPTQDFKATEGIDPTWDAGVILRHKIAVTATKVWVGGPKVKPTIEFQLYRNGDAFGEPVELKHGTTEYTWQDLYETDTNKDPYVYTVEEINTPSEYNQTVEETESNKFTITNTRKTYAMGDYVWIDTNKDGKQDADEKPLPGVKVELFDENGKKIAETTTDKNGHYLFDELESGKYKVKFTLTDEQKKRYTFTKRHSGDAANDSNADDEGWTIEIDLSENNAFLTLDYTDQTFKASEGIDPTWDAGVILLDIPVEPKPEEQKPTNPNKPSTTKPLPQMGEAGNPVLLTTLGILLIGSVAGIATTRRRRKG